MEKDEAEVELLPREIEHQKSTSSWKVWKLLTLFLIFGIISVWVVFTLFPSIEANSRHSLGEKRLSQAESSILTTNCTVSYTNVTQKWLGFEEVVPGTLIYSAYYDNTRKTPFVRMIAVSETFRPPKIFCHSLCDRKKMKEANVHLVQNHKERRHAAFIVSCEQPRELGRAPRSVSISVEYDEKRSDIFTFGVHSTAVSKDMIDYAVCIPPLYGDQITLTNFVEFIEMNRIFGASKFYIYNESIGKRLSKVMKRYQRQGVVMVMPWNLPFYINNFYGIHYHGQLAAIQDCLYRNRGKAKWVGFHDFDEFLVPLKQPTIPSLLKNIYNYEASGYCIQSVLLPKNNVFTAEEPTNRTLITQQYVFRTKTVFRKKIRSKCVVDPRKVFEMGIHYVTKPVYANYLENWVSPKEMLVFHYRQCVRFDDLKEACRKLVQEGFMLKYKKIIRRKVDNVIRSIS